MKKNILVILRSAPYGTSKARDAIDLILTSAAYDQDIHVLFSHDGVFQIVENQAPQALELKRISSLISAFEMYDIENVFCDSTSLTERNISVNQLINGIRPIDQTEIATLINNADTVLSF